MALIRMYQRRGTLEQWNTGVIPDTVILQPGEIGIETDTGRFKIGTGTKVWKDLPYYLPDNNPSNIAIRQGKNAQDVYSRLSPLGPTYSQNFTGTQVMVPQSNSQVPLVVSGLAGQSAVLQRWRDSNDTTLASIDQTGKLTADGGAAFNNIVNVNNNRITNVATPTNDNDAVSKIYVDNAIAGLAWKEAVHLIAHGTGANVALTGNTGTLVIDGHDPLVQADSGIYRILLTAQTTASQNGIYVYNDNGTTYTLVRATDADNPVELQGSSVYVQEGTTYGTSSWVQSNYTMDAFEEQVWVQFSGAALITAGLGMTKDGNTLDVNGTTDRITANADSIDIASTYVGQASITTLGTITTGTWNASVIGATKGGTGISSYSVGDILYADTTTTLAKLVPGTAGHPLVSGGTGAAPSYAQVGTTGIADDAVTYDKLQNVGGQYRVLGRISSGSGNVQELDSDNLMTVINQGNTDIAFNLLPVGTTSTTVAQGDHTHTLDNLSDVVITGTPALRQVLKYNGTNWINELPSGGISIGATPPTEASSGDAWFDSTDGSLYVYYDDGVGSPSAQWVQVKANSALEASILTRLSAVEARDTKLEAANAVRVANQAERDSVYPAPVQGNTVFRADLGYEEKYYAAYNATTNPDGTTGTVGWYEYRGGTPLSKNYVINGAMDWWQRGISGFTAGSQYTTDRWYGVYSGPFDVVKETTIVPTNIPTSAKISTTVGGSSMNLYQVFEYIDISNLVGKTVTLSASIYGVGDIGLKIEYGTTADQGVNSGTYTSILSQTNTYSVAAWTKKVITANIPSNAKQIRIGIYAKPLNTGSSIYVSGVQLEEGPVATPFRRNQPNPQAELAACQRYYAQFDSGTFYAWTRGPVDVYHPWISYPVEMRVSPTVSGSFTQGGGTFTVGVESNKRGLYLYNSANNWGTNVEIKISATMSAEL